MSNALNYLLQDFKCATKPKIKLQILLLITITLVFLNKQQFHLKKKDLYPIHACV